MTQDSAVADGDGGLRTQLLRGVLDMCLLAVIRAEPAYGYVLTQRMAEQGLSVAAGSIYPALGRLRRTGLVVTQERAGAGGPARTYYHATEAGERAFLAWLEEWGQFRDSVRELLASTGSTSNERYVHER